MPHRDWVNETVWETQFKASALRFHLSAFYAGWSGKATVDEAQDMAEAYYSSTCGFKSFDPHSGAGRKAISVTRKFSELGEAWARDEAILENIRSLLALRLALYRDGKSPVDAVNVLVRYIREQLKHPDKLIRDKGYLLRFCGRRR